MFVQLIWLFKVKSDVYINKKCMCHQAFQRPSKSFGTSLLEDSGACLHNSIAYSVLQNIEIFMMANESYSFIPFSKVCNCLFLFKK